ncbi:hypothetical protein Ocin01_19580 [Orchesella cincta]|uniref:Uncharacterized protein n=1 Tax=Orchesella cincta TaxID=48709 RepID=A0A1D2M2D9_ORCCI|nr:hypothetical protein Ocin01_19580 [Orchesella cincta]
MGMERLTGVTNMTTQWLKCNQGLQMEQLLHRLSKDYLPKDSNGTGPSNSFFHVLQ